MGHNGERSRGATVLRGWPDAEWRIVREGANDGREPPPDAARFFTAEGRDVAVPETRMKYDSTRRRLTLVRGNRAAYAVDKHAESVTAIVERRPGITATVLTDELARVAGLTRDPARDAVRSVVSTGLIHTHPGPRRAFLHYPGQRCDECPE